MITSVSLALDTGITLLHVMYSITNPPEIKPSVPKLGCHISVNASELGLLFSSCL